MFEYVCVCVWLSECNTEAKLSAGLVGPLPLWSPAGVLGCLHQFRQGSLMRDVQTGFLTDGTVDLHKTNKQTTQVALSAKPCCQDKPQMMETFHITPQWIQASLKMGLWRHLVAVLKSNIVHFLRVYLPYLCKFNKAVVRLLICLTFIGHNLTQLTDRHEHSFFIVLHRAHDDTSQVLHQLHLT